MRAKDTSLRSSSQACSAASSDRCNPTCRSCIARAWRQPSSTSVRPASGSANRSHLCDTARSTRVKVLPSLDLFKWVRRVSVSSELSRAWAERIASRSRESAPEVNGNSAMASACSSINQGWFRITLINSASRCGGRLVSAATSELFLRLELALTCSEPCPRLGGNFFWGNPRRTPGLAPNRVF